MVHRCENCDTELEVVRPQRGEMDAVLRCGGCRLIVELDAQPSAPVAVPAGQVTYKPTVYMWLN